ncbi:MAG: nucleotidyltransferase family protein [Candidatus Micrarchaeota archaeon]
MIGIILAAGRGTRLRPLTYAIPKPLLPVGGKPVLEYAIENLKACKEIKKIYVAVSHSRELIENYLQHVDYGIEIETVHTLGWETGGDLKTIITSKEITDNVIVAYGDIVSKIDVNEMLNFHKKQNKPATVALFAVPKEDVYRFGIAEVQNNLVKRFVEKPKLEDAPSNLANAGYYILEKSAYSKLVMEKKKVEETLFPELAPSGNLAGYVCKPDYWLDIGTIESYRKANRMIEGIIAPNVNGK